ncbi:MAG: MiaB/RimO family radical SAM methylthiotransferase, partial [Lentisphaeria bacterium]|nr:MiaB/RimO family radical SAM methylthiotransferase [Lentisphaeria bacterium]
LKGSEKNSVASHLGQRLRHDEGPPLVPAGQETREHAFTESGVGLFLERTRANVKIQEGCDFFCSYCIVPFARGGPRSRDWDDILREVTELARRGHKEIVLTGVNIATYDHGGKDLADLVACMLSVAAGFRIRLSSTEPGEVLRRIVDIMAAEPRLCRFLHLPMQYGEDGILEAMNRRYTVAEFAERTRSAAKQVPGLCIGTDIIVGFPGETEEAFQQCCTTVRELPLSHLHVFTYSPRKGTPAARMSGCVPGDVASRRANELMAIGEEKKHAFLDAQMGETVRVLCEEKNADGLWEGWSDNYLRVAIREEKGPPLAQNQLVSLRLVSHEDGLASGVPICAS